MVKYILNDGGSVLVTSYASHLCKLQHQHQSVECDACECDYGHTGRRPLRTLVPFGPAGVGASPCFLFSPLSLFPPLGQNLSLSLSLTQPHRRFRLFRFGFLPLEAIARSTPPPPHQKPKPRRAAAEAHGWIRRRRRMCSAGPTSSPGSPTARQSVSSSYTSPATASSNLASSHLNLVSI